MTVSKVLAVAPVNDLDAAVDWYQRLLGRPADARPMATLADWHVTDSAWVQVFHDPEHAGSSLFNLVVDDLDAHVARLAAQGITAGSTTTTNNNSKLAAVIDPAGNVVTLIENPTV